MEGVHSRASVCPVSRNILCQNMRAQNPSTVNTCVNSPPHTHTHSPHMQLTLSYLNKTLISPLHISYNGTLLMGFGWNGRNGTSSYNNNRSIWLVREWDPPSFLVIQTLKASHGWWRGEAELKWTDREWRSAQCLMPDWKEQVSILCSTTWRTQQG